jgi:hypothetical protein
MGCNHEEKLVRDLQVVTAERDGLLGIVREAMAVLTPAQFAELRERLDAIDWSGLVAAELEKSP